MIVRETRGRSFKGAIAYLVHDKEADTRERLLWARTINLPTSDPEKAAKVMAWTAQNQNTLKQLAGISARGRKAQNPVVHFSLNWSPDESVTADQMAQAAREFLAHMGMEKHQAILTAHGDTKHQHVHLLINAVDHETGKMHPLKFTKETASRWAEAYERQRGAILCKNREFNNAARAEGHKVIDFESRRREKAYQEYLKQLEAEAKADRANPDPDRFRAKDFEWTPSEHDRRALREEYRRDRAKPPTLSDEFEAKARKAAKDAGQALRKARADTWQEIKDRQKEERDALSSEIRRRYKDTAREIREAWKPRFRDLYRSEKQATRFIRNQAFRPNGKKPSLFAKVVHLVADFWGAATGNDNRAAYAEMRTQLKAEQDAAVKQAFIRVRQSIADQRDQLKERHSEERKAHWQETSRLWEGYRAEHGGKSRGPETLRDDQDSSLTSSFQSASSGSQHEGRGSEARGSYGRGSGGRGNEGRGTGGRGDGGHDYSR